MSCRKASRHQVLAASGYSAHPLASTSSFSFLFCCPFQCLCCIPGPSNKSHLSSRHPPFGRPVPRRAGGGGGAAGRTVGAARRAVVPAGDARLRLRGARPAARGRGRPAAPGGGFRGGRGAARRVCGAVPGPGRRAVGCTLGTNQGPIRPGLEELARRCAAIVAMFSARCRAASRSTVKNQGVAVPPACYTQMLAGLQCLAAEGRGAAVRVGRGCLNKAVRALSALPQGMLLRS